MNRIGQMSRHFYSNLSISENPDEMEKMYAIQDFNKRTETGTVFSK